MPTLSGGHLPFEVESHVAGKAAAVLFDFDTSQKSSSRIRELVLEK